MRQKRVWRYYCDFCKKSGCSSHHIKKHEKHCTMNPNRECRMCKHAGIEQKPINILISALGDGSNLTSIKDLSNNCPVCILSAIRQSGIQHFDYDEEGFIGTYVDFDFKKEMRERWEEIRTQEFLSGHLY